MDKIFDLIINDFKLKQFFCSLLTHSLLKIHHLHPNRKHKSQEFSLALSHNFPSIKIIIFFATIISCKLI